MSTCKLSIVSTVYKSEKTIDEFCQRAEKCARSLVNHNYEIIIIDDGSPDESACRVRALMKKNVKIKLFSLSRNFGHHNAMLAGLEKSCGDMIFLIDSDLEEKPEWMIDFFDCYSTHGFDSVYGFQRERKGKLFERLSGAFWYRFLSFLVGTNVNLKNQVTARLMSREYVDALLVHQERTTVISALFWLAGFRQKGIAIKKLSNSPSTYTFKKKISYVIATIVGITNKPLYLVLSLNFLIAFLTFSVSLYLVLSQLNSTSKVEGWASLALLSTTSFLLLSSCLIVIGFYIAQMNTELKSRPRYITMKNKREN